MKISSEASGLSPVKIDYSYYPKSFINRINEVYFFFIKYRYTVAIASELSSHVRRLRVAFVRLSQA